MFKVQSLKQWLPDIVAVVLFAVISFAYFFPADIEGRILYRHDSSASRGAGQEASEYYQRTGERSRWTNALFGGMPTYQIAPSYKSTELLQQAEKAYHLWLPENVWYVFAYLLGFYILLRAFDFRWYLAMLGGIVWAFSSYFFIIIAAGHIWKVIALAPRAGLSREIPVGTGGDGTVCSAGNIGQPRADDVLLPVYRAGDGHCVHH